MEELSKIIDELRDEMTDMLKRWLRVPSIREAAAPGAPFGPVTRQMLDMALADAEKLGFDARNFDGYAGDVRMGQIGVDPLGILAHLDVVPAGDGWETDPFEPVQEGDRIYARGFAVSATQVHFGRPWSRMRLLSVSSSSAIFSVESESKASDFT